MFAFCSAPFRASLPPLLIRLAAPFSVLSGQEEGLRSARKETVQFRIKKGNSKEKASASRGRQRLNRRQSASAYVGGAVFSFSPSALVRVLLAFFGNDRNVGTGVNRFSRRLLLQAFSDSSKAEMFVHFALVGVCLRPFQRDGQSWLAPCLNGGGRITQIGCSPLALRE